MRIFFTAITVICFYTVAFGQDWTDVPVPAYAGDWMKWELQDTISDDFNYTFNETNSLTDFGEGKWYNFYHNSWTGPGTTYWQYDHVSVDGSDLVIRASRNPSTSKMGVPGVNAACITSNNRVRFPVFVEASVSVANIALASDVWLLSADDWQEIDIIECYGGIEPDNAFYAKYIHLSHHSFERSNSSDILDYQPRDHNSWWQRSGVSSWGEYCWNGGDRRYVQVGVNWIDSIHFEYYVDGELVRVLYDKAFATKKGSTWYYTYPGMTGGVLDMANGYQVITQYATGTEYSFETLEEASNLSNTSVIDPYNYQDGTGYVKELDIIINVESQNWHVEAGRTPSDADLNDASMNTMKVDWIRVYKPVDDPEWTPPSSTAFASDEMEIYPNPVSDYCHIKSDISLDHVIIYNIYGAIVKNQQVNSTSAKIITNDLNAGTYIIKIQYEDGTWSSKKLLKL